MNGYLISVSKIHFHPHKLNHNHLQSSNFYLLNNLHQRFARLNLPIPKNRVPQQKT